MVKEKIPEKLQIYKTICDFTGKLLFYGIFVSLQF